MADQKAFDLEFSQLFNLDDSELPPLDCGLIPSPSLHKLDTADTIQFDGATGKGDEYVGTNCAVDVGLEENLQKLLTFESASNDGSWGVDPAVFGGNAFGLQLGNPTLGTSWTDSQAQAHAAALHQLAEQHQQELTIKPEELLSPAIIALPEHQGSYGAPSFPALFEPSAPDHERPSPQSARGKRNTKRRRTTSSPTSDLEGDERQDTLPNDKKASSTEKYSIANVGTSVEELREFIDKIEKDETVTPKEKRQIRNKISARNFRLRKKEHLTQLEEEIRSVKGENAQLKEKLTVMERDNAQLRQELESLKKRIASDANVICGSVPFEEAETTSKSPQPVPIQIPVQPVATFATAAPAAAGSQSATDVIRVNTPTITPRRMSPACSPSPNYGTTWPNRRLQVHMVHMVHSVMVPAARKACDEQSFEQFADLPDALSVNEKARSFLSAVSLLSPPDRATVIRETESNISSRNRRRRSRQERALRIAWESVKLGQIESVGVDMNGTAVRALLVLSYLASSGVVRVVV